MNLYYGCHVAAVAGGGIKDTVEISRARRIGGCQPGCTNSYAVMIGEDGQLLPPMNIACGKSKRIS